MKMTGGAFDEKIDLPKNDHSTIFIACIGSTSQHFNAQVSTLKCMDKARNFSSSNLDLKAILAKRRSKQIGKSGNDGSGGNGGNNGNSGNNTPTACLEGNGESKKDDRGGGVQPSVFKDRKNIVAELTLEIEKEEEREFARIAEAEAAKAESEAQKERKEEEEGEGKMGTAKAYTTRDKERMLRRENAKIQKAKKMRAEQEEGGSYPKQFRGE